MCVYIRSYLPNAETSQPRIEIRLEREKEKEVVVTTDCIPAREEAMGAGILPDLWTLILIPLCAVVGIAFSLIQWVVVSRVKVSVEKQSPPANNKNGFSESLIEEEEGINDHSVVQKCAEIQNAISEGETFSA